MNNNTIDKNNFGSIPLPGGVLVAPEECPTAKDLLVAPVAGLQVGLPAGVVPRLSVMVILVR